MDNTGKAIIFGTVALMVLYIRRAVGGATDIPIRPTALEKQVMRHGDLIWRMGMKYNVEPALIAAIMANESSGISRKARPVSVVLYDGSRGTDYVAGLMQVRLDTAITNCNIWHQSDLEPDAANVECGVTFLRILLNKYDVDAAVSAYNAGAGSIKFDTSMVGGMQYVNVGYIRNVLGMIPRFRLLFMAAQGANAYLVRFPGERWRYDTP